MKFIAISLLLIPFLKADSQPAPKFPIGKDTTYVTGPLDSEGYIDYVAAQNEYARKGISPEKNANVLIWTALGPAGHDGKPMPAEFFRRLGMAVPPKGGKYFMDLSAYQKKLNLDNQKFNAIIDQSMLCGKRPWKAQEFPHIAEYLRLNEKPLAVVIEATRRPGYYNPLVRPPNKPQPQTLIEAFPFSSFFAYSELSHALLARAMLRVGEGKVAEAWQDLLACHRLSRLVAQGASGLEAIYGIATERLASEADLGYIEGARLTANEIEARLRDLDKLPQKPSVADSTEFGEHVFHLDELQLVRRHGLVMLERLSDLVRIPPLPAEKYKKAGADELKALDRINWTPVLKDANRYWDRYFAALRLKTRPERVKAFDMIVVDLKALKKTALTTTQIEKLFLNKNSAQAAGKAIGDFLLCLGDDVNMVRTMMNAQDRSEQIWRNLHIAFALAAYRSDHGRYPAKLDDLAPKYLTSVPDDIFAGKPLIYRPSNKGYLFYSVGVNGKDDGGRSIDDMPEGDDLAVRMPLPELKIEQ